MFRLFRKPKILIIGSKGVIGKILTGALSNRFDIYGIDMKEGNERNYFRADISNYEDLDEIFKKIGCIDCIVHLAGNPNQNASWESVLKNNIIGTRNIYECAKEHRIKKVVFASSIHVLNALRKLREPSQPRITVDHLFCTDSDYGSSKAFGEIIARQYFERYKIKSVCLRIGCVLRDDDPTGKADLLNIWLSHRDLVELIERSVRSDIKFGIYYGVSNNKENSFDISNAQKELGYRPKDDAYLIHSKIRSV
jgi:nucleoside-diphosphate-sugar epimerase